MRKNEGQAIVIKYFFFLDLVFLQILDHFPEKLVFTKLVFDLDLEFFYARFNHPLEVDLTIPKTQHYSNFQNGSTPWKSQKAVGSKRKTPERKQQTKKDSHRASLFEGKGRGINSSQRLGDDFMSASPVIPVLGDAVAMIAVSAPTPVTATKLTFSFHTGKYFHASHQKGDYILPITI